MPNSPYLLKAEHQEYAQRMHDEHKRLDRRMRTLEEHQEQMTELTISVKELAMSVKASTEIQKEHTERLEELEARDGEKWRETTKYVLFTCLGIVISYLFKVIGIM